MSSSPSASSSPFLWCRSCHIVVDSSSALGLPCPFCGIESITEITDPRILVLLGSLNHGSSEDAAEGISNSYGDGDSILHRSPSLLLEDSTLSSLRRMREFLAFLARDTRETDLENAEEEQYTQRIEFPSHLSPSLPGHALTPVPEDESFDEDHSYEFIQSFGENDNHEGNRAPGPSILLSHVRNTGDDVGERSTEGFLYPMLEFIMQHFAQTESSRYGSAPASKAAIAALPTLQFRKTCLDEEDMYCAICKELFECGDDVKEMPCKHIYHCGCLLPWLELHSSCPLCRNELPVEEYTGGSVEEPMTIPVESGENSLALFEITSEGIHVLSFVLFGTYTNEGENQQTLESTTESEGNAQEATSMVAVDGDEESRLVSLERQDGKLGSVAAEHKAGLVPTENVQAAEQQTLSSEAAIGTSGFDITERSSPTIALAGGTSYIQHHVAHSTLPAVATRQERRNEVLHGIRSATVNVGNEIGSSDGATGSRHSRFRGSNSLERSLMFRVRSFLSWLFGSAHRTSSVEDTNGARHSCW